MFTAKELSAAIVIWTGWGFAPRPQRNETRLVEFFGAEAAIALIPHLRQLEDDFYLSKAFNTAGTLVEMGDVGAADFRAKHPEIGGDAVEALAWCYTFDYK
jgi:hypothetical protein